MYAIWLKFIICAGLIFVAGRYVARYADVIAEKTGMSRLWVGVILVAVATSLPELFTGVGSVVFVNAPDLTVGDLIGSNAYNLLIIALLDVLYRGSPLLNTMSSGQLLTAVFTLIPITLVTIAIILRGDGVLVWSVGNVGIFSIAVVISYFIMARILYKFEKRKKEKPEPADLVYENIPLKKAYTYYGLAAVVIVACGIWLAYIGRDLAGVMHLNESSVGSFFIAFVTSLPEITVSIAALMIGAREIAVANMFGSNLFNMAIIFVDDVLYKKGPILGAVSPDHIQQACIVMAMTAVIIMAMVLKRRNKIFSISWYVPVLLIVFLFGAYINFSN